MSLDRNDCTKSTTARIITKTMMMISGSAGTHITMKARNAITIANADNSGDQSWS